MGVKISPEQAFVPRLFQQQVLPATTMWAQLLLHRRWKHSCLSAPSFPCELSPWTEPNQSLLFAYAFESPPWATVYIQATGLFAARPLCLCSGIHSIAWMKPFFYSVVLCAKLSLFSSPFTPPSWFFHLSSDPHTWAGACVVWTLLNESLWTSYHHSQHTAYEYAYAQWLLTNCKARLQCQPAAGAEPHSILHL